MLFCFYCITTSFTGATAYINQATHGLNYFRSSRVLTLYQDKSYTVKKIKLFQLCILLFLFCFYSVNGQIPFPPKKLIFHHISMNPLAVTDIHCMLQDKEGFIWFCTGEALCRYDGYEIKPYRHDPTDSLSRPSGRASCMLEDDDGVIWMGTYQGGLVSFNKKTGHFHAYKHIKGDSTSLPQNSVKGLYRDKVGILWMGSVHGDFCSFNPKTGKFHSCKSNPSWPNFLVEYDINGIQEDHNGLLWISTYYGLGSFDRKTEKTIWYKHKDYDINSPGSDELYNLFKDKHGKLWYSTSTGELDEFDPATLQFIHHKKELQENDSLPVNIVVSYCEDRLGRLWVGTEKGLYIYNKDSESFFGYHHDIADSTSLRNNKINSIFEDASGLLWLGTSDAGLDYTTMNKVRFDMYKCKPDEFKTGSENYIFYIYEDLEGIIWVGGYKTGLYILDQHLGYFSHYKDDPVAKESKSHMNAICSIREDADGTLWLGTNGDGLYSLNKKTGVHNHYYNDGKALHPIQTNTIISMNNDDPAYLWTGNYGGGINKFEKSTGYFTTYLNDTADVNQKGKDNVFCILADTGTFFWLGTGGGGLNLFNKSTGKFTAYLNDPHDKNSLSSNIIYSLYKDAKGIIWVGTAEGGLNAFNPQTKKFTSYTEKDGVADNAIVGILPDSKGNLWCSTQTGLMKFTPPKTIPGDGSKGNFSIHNYDVNDGLMDGFGTGPYWKTKDGHLFFGGVGINAFHPDSIKDNPYLPPVVLTSFKIFEKDFPLDTTISYKKTITLSYKENFFSFEFAALNFLYPEKNKFLYKMEGFNDNWIDPGKRRYASFTNLDPGTYTFIVKAANNDGVWNEVGTFINIIITPPFWKTWWFITICLLTGIFVLYIIYRSRINQLLQLQNIRNKIASDLHDDVGSTLSSISIFSEIAKEQNSDIGHLLDQIGDSSRKMLDAMADIVWTINPENDQFEKIILRMRSFAYELLGAKKIDFEFEADENITSLKLPMDVRKNLYLIFKEATNNIVKYAGASKATFKVSGTKEKLIMLITDNGKGFDVRSGSQGNGLKNMKRRAEEIGAQLLIESGIGNGTTIQLVVALR